MVIDKWTRNSSNNNKSLTIPLLDHKSKDSFIELKQSYERLKVLNHKYKKWRNISLIRNNLNASIGINSSEIKEYMEQINLILISLDEIISENCNYEEDQEKMFNINEKNNIYNDIENQFDEFIENMKVIRKIKNINYNFDINSCFSKIQNTINNIYKKINKEKKIENIEFVQEESNQNLLDINPNIDRGQINIFSSKREYNNSRIIEKNNIHFSVEEESLSNFVRFILFCFGLCFLLYICYICIL